MPAPLLSCILPTWNRRRFLPQALRCFQCQTWERKELIVVDDSDRASYALFAGLPDVRYLRLASRTRLGLKANLAIEAARGEIIQRLDDDDYYGPGFLRHSARALRSAGPDALVTRCCFLVLFPGRTPLRHSGHGWRPGGTFCFRKNLWRSVPFRDTAQSEDTWFLRDHDPELIRLCRPDPEDYIVVRHGGNTWTRMTTGGADQYLAACQPYPRTLAEVTSPGTARWYRRLWAR